MRTQQNILVAGSSSGFGFLIARTLLNDGHTVFAVMRGLDNKNVDAVLNLIRTPAGRRPLRTVVDPMGGDASGAINSTTDQIQKQMFEQMEIKDLLSVKP